MPLNTEVDEQIEVPVVVGAALKALAIGAASAEQQKRAYHFILHGLSGVDRSSFVQTEDTALVMAWREGRRFVGRNLRRIVETPIPAKEDKPSRRPRQRTATETIERGDT